MPEFRAAMEAYYDAVGACGADLMRAVAVSLDVDADFFADKYQKRLQRTQVVYYPPQPPDATDEQFGVAPHTDFGCITLLWPGRYGRAGSAGKKIALMDARPADPRHAGGQRRRSAGPLDQRPLCLDPASRHQSLGQGAHVDRDLLRPPTIRRWSIPAPWARRMRNAATNPVLAGDHIVGRIERSFGYRKTVAAA